MIHQLIFAGPKPGLTAEGFQSYWLNFHAVDYAAKIPQIRQYLVATRIPLSYPREVPFFEGVAEIWLRNEEEQIASMRSAEFLQGARLDEPRWAAFWRTFVQDSETVVTRDGPEFPDGGVKFYVFLKRRVGSLLAEFKKYIHAEHSNAITALPGIGRCVGAFARKDLYGFGEPRFDAIEIWGFSNERALQTAVGSPEMHEIEKSWRRCANEEALFTLGACTHWIIPPGTRA